MCVCVLVEIKCSKAKRGGGKRIRAAGLKENEKKLKEAEEEAEELGNDDASRKTR